MYKTLSRHLQHGEGKERTLSPETLAYEKRKYDKVATIASAHKGKMVVGRITKIMDYGAFVDINGVSGFVHISELSNKRVSNISKELTVGCTYEFIILEVGLNKKGNISFKLTRKVDSYRQEHNVEKKDFSNTLASSLKNLQISPIEILNKENLEKSHETSTCINDKNISQSSSIVDEYEDIKI